jgi:cell wall-associated NlpC family hydrolase
MNQNASKLIMLLLPFLFFMASCSSTSRTYNDSSRSNTSRKSADRGSRKELRKDIAKHSRQYKGIKYKYAGKTPKTGFDCSGFTSYVMRKFNIEISSVSKSQARTGKEIPLKRVKPGDLIFFGKGRKVTHVALVTKNTRDGIFVIHSTSSKGIMEQNVSKSSYWKPKILFARDVITR